MSVVLVVTTSVVCVVTISGSVTATSVLVGSVGAGVVVVGIVGEIDGARVVVFGVGREVTVGSGVLSGREVVEVESVSFCPKTEHDNWNKTNT